MTLLECLLAMAILSIVLLGLTFTTSAGQQHLRHSDVVFRAIRLAEHLIEEIASRPYDGHGVDRPSYHIDDYNGFAEPSGELTDCSGASYDARDQIFSRSVTVTSSNQVVGDLDGAAVPGKIIVVTMQGPSGGRWQLSRFIPEPVSP